MTPDFPIIDAHVHLWDPRHNNMPWLVGLDTLNRPFGPAEYQAAGGTGAVAAFVCVEAGVAPADALREAHWLAGLAEQEPRVGAVVAQAPMEDGERVQPHLDSLAAALGNRLKGVRRLLQDEQDAEFCLRPGFVAGIRLLAQRGLSFDISIVPRQLAAVIKLVQQCPATSFVLDHCAKPAITTGLGDPWREQIAQLAALPNVVCKISGLVTEADHARWTADDLRPYVEHVIEQFGPQRVLFGSDWPVALLASSYARWVETLAALTAQLNPAERLALWGENARRVYRVEPQ